MQKIEGDFVWLFLCMFLQEERNIVFGVFFGEISNSHKIIPLCCNCLIVLKSGVVVTTELPHFFNALSNKKSFAIILLIEVDIAIPSALATFERYFI